MSPFGQEAQGQQLQPLLQPRPPLPWTITGGQGGGPQRAQTALLGGGCPFPGPLQLLDRPSKGLTLRPVPTPRLCPEEREVAEVNCPHPRPVPRCPGGLLTWRPRRCPRKVWQLSHLELCSPGEHLRVRRHGLPEGRRKASKTQLSIPGEGTPGCPGPGKLCAVQGEWVPPWQAPRE